MANIIAASPGVEITPSGQLATAATYQSVYDFSDQNLPDEFLELYPQYGNGKLTSFCKIVGAEKPFKSDVLIWGEQGRLMQITQSVTVTGDSFDCGAVEHNLRIGDTIWASDGAKQLQGDVYEITDAFIFKAYNRSATGAFNFGGTVSLFAASNEFAKKTDNFTQGREWNPEIKKNYPQIIKAFYDVAKSDMAQATWLSAPGAGKDRWFVYNWERERVHFENLIELTAIFNVRAVATSASAVAGKEGMDGVVPQLQVGGNVGNGNISTLDDIDDWTKRFRKQGKSSVYTAWNDQLQMIDYNNFLSGINAYFSGGANYGLFDNDKDLALHLDFYSFERNGYTFHLTRLDALDDPTLFGEDNFLTTGVGSLLVPGTETYMTMDGITAATPYFVTRKRISGDIDRSLEVKLIGTPENPISKDALEVHYLTEMSNQVVGANEWAVNFR